MRPSLPVCRKAEISVAYRLFSQSTFKQDLSQGGSSYMKAGTPGAEAALFWLLTAWHDVVKSITPLRNCSSILCNISSPHLGWWRWLKGAKGGAKGEGQRPVTGRCMARKLVCFQVKKEISGGAAQEELWCSRQGYSCWDCYLIASPSSISKYEDELLLAWKVADGLILRFSLARAKWYTVFVLNHNSF